MAERAGDSSRRLRLSRRSRESSSLAVSSGTGPARRQPPISVRSASGLGRGLMVDGFEGEVFGYSAGLSYEDVDNQGLGDPRKGRASGSW
jgi:hypothetical protein